MNKLDKYKKIVTELDKLYLSENFLEEGNRFTLIVNSTCNFISFNNKVLLFIDTEDKQTDYRDILNECKFRWEDYINELTKFKTK